MQSRTPKRKAIKSDLVPKERSGGEEGGRWCHFAGALAPCIDFSPPPSLTCFFYTLATSAGLLTRWHGEPSLHFSTPLEKKPPTCPLLRDLCPKRPTAAAAAANRLGRRQQQQSQQRDLACRQERGGEEIQAGGRESKAPLPSILG